MPIKDGSDPARDRGGVVHRRQRERMAGGHKVAPADGEEEESGVTDQLGRPSSKLNRASIATPRTSISC